jgi:cbb3-type cytochrome oxidase cytochrome c subunit
MTKRQITAITILSVLFSIILLPGTNTSKADETLNGKDIFVAKKCNMCHPATTQEIACKKKDTPDFGTYNLVNKEAAALKQYLNKETELNAKKHPVAFKGEAPEFDALVNWLIEISPKPEQP